MNVAMKGLTALAVAVLLAFGGAFIYALTHQQEFELPEVADTIEIKTDLYVIDDPEVILTDATYTLYVNESWQIKVFRYPINITVGFAEDHPNTTIFDAFEVQVCNMTNDVIVASFNMTSQSVFIESPANQEYYYVFAFHIRADAPDGVVPRLLLEVDTPEEE